MLENIGNKNPQKEGEPQVPPKKDFSNIYWEMKNKQNFLDPEDSEEERSHQQQENKKPDDDFDS